jgi:hypothetical protein
MRTVPTVGEPVVHPFVLLQRYEPSFEKDRVLPVGSTVVSTGLSIDAIWSLVMTNWLPVAAVPRYTPAAVVILVPSPVVDVLPLKIGLVLRGTAQSEHGEC